LPGNRLAVLVADVSGKGISAALLMAKVSAEARYLLASEASPAQAVNRLSAGFEGHGWDDRFVTFILAVIHCDEHEVVLVNAGHMPPFLRHTDGRVETVGAGAAGVPVGVDPSWKYEESRVKLLPGESLTAFTDGFSEAVNASGQMYGLEELERQVGERADNVQQLGQHILNKVKSFVGGYRQSDDMCLLCLGRTK
jgi:serine phosphatase RsbU (regulator of sigma subunit)